MRLTAFFRTPGSFHLLQSPDGAVRFLVSTRSAPQANSLDCRLPHVGLVTATFTTDCSLGSHGKQLAQHLSMRSLQTEQQLSNHLAVGRACKAYSCKT